jgi:hypothetical protein
MTPEQQWAAFQQFQAQQAAAQPAAQFPTFTPPNALQQFQQPAQSGNPGIGTPVPPAPQIEVSLDAFLGQQATAGGASLPIGDMQEGQSVTIQFKVDIDKTHIRPQTKPNSTEVLYQSDGNPRLVMVAPVVRLDNGEDAAWFVSGAHWDALKSGMAAVGCSGVPKMGDMAQITVTRKFKNKFQTISTSIKVVYARNPQATPAAPQEAAPSSVTAAPVAPVPASVPVATPSAVPPAATATIESVQPVPAAVQGQFAGLPPEVAAQLAAMTGGGSPAA